MACPAATATSGDGATVQPCSALLFLAHVTLFVHLFWAHGGGMGRGAWQHCQFWPDWAASRLVLSALRCDISGGSFSSISFFVLFFWSCLPARAFCSSVSAFVCLWFCLTFIA